MKVHFLTINSTISWGNQMHIKNYVWFIILFCSSLMFAQEKMKFDFDYAKFNYDSNSVYLEVYYSFNKSSLTKIEENGVTKVEAVLHISIQDTSTNDYVVNRNWKLSDVISNDEAGVQDQVGVLGFVLDRGIYNINVVGKDINAEDIEKEISEILEVTPYLENDIRISDIQLASRIITDGADANSIFYKNTLEVIPNPTRIYTEDSPVLFYYAEVYNLLNNSGGVYKFEKMIYNSTGTNYYKKSKIVNTNQNSIVDVGLINISKYPSGSYNMVLTMLDTTTNSAVVSIKRFYLYNPNVDANEKNQFVNSTFAGSEFSVMSEEECDNLFAIGLYLASVHDRNTYENLKTVEAKQTFLFDFWKAKDLVPDTPDNEFKREYLLRVSYCNKNFRNRLREGYQSDMGRVYVLYGPPDERDYVPMSDNSKPYETWRYYQIEGGVEFTFGDLTNFGNYELLHSTKRGEVYDRNWESRLRQIDNNVDEYDNFR